MARIKKCPECSQVMFVENEKYDNAGMTVWHVCNNNECPFYKRGGYRYKFKEYQGN